MLRDVQLLREAGQLAVVAAKQGFVEADQGSAVGGLNIDEQVDFAAFGVVDDQFAQFDFFFFVIAGQAHFQVGEFGVEGANLYRNNFTLVAARGAAVAGHGKKHKLSCGWCKKKGGKGR